MEFFVLYDIYIDFKDEMYYNSTYRRVFILEKCSSTFRVDYK